MKDKFRSFLRQYWDDFSLPFAGWAIALTALFYIFRELIFSKAGTLLVAPVLSQCSRDKWEIDIIFLGVGLLAVFKLWQRCRNGLLPTPGSLVGGMVVLFIYFAFCRYATSFYYYNFTLPLLNQLAYLDILLLSVVTLFSTYKTYKSPLEKTPSIRSFIEDASDIEGKDVLSYSGYSGVVKDYILGTTTKNSSFAIAVTGQWGSGKTFFLKRLQEDLKHEENIIYEFNPWRTAKTDAIVEEFFTGLSLKLKPFNHSTAPLIRDYSRRILQTGEEAHIRLLDTLIGQWLPEADIRERYDAINLAIRQTGKRLIVFIDDLDRLSGKEIMEVLRIIRNTASFANTFFVAAYDEEYVVQSIANTKEYANETGYLKKVFQHMVTLPVFKKEILSRELERHLFTADFEEQDRQNIREVLTRLNTNPSEIVSRILPADAYVSFPQQLLVDLRDVKRFCNSFKISYHLMKDETDLNDLFVLEMIRTASLSTYNLIRSRQLLDFNLSNTDKYSLKQKELEKIKPVGLQDAVHYLVSNAGYKNERRFEIPVNFFLYFAYQLDDLVSKKEFYEVLKLSPAQILERFEQWTSELRHEELFRLVDKAIDAADADTLLKIFEVILRMSGDFKIWFTYANDFLFSQSHKIHQSLFKGNLADHKSFVMKILDNQAIAPYRRALLARDFLEAFRSPVPDMTPKQLVFSKNEWQQITFGLFKDYLAGLHEFSPETLEFFYLNVEGVNGKNEVVLSEEACTLFREKLLNDPRLFAGYVAYLIRPVVRPNSVQLVLEPWFKQVFPSWMEFVNHLRANEGIPDKLQQIILQYGQAFHSSQTAFSISDEDDARFLEDWMRMYLLVSVKIPLLQLDGNQLLAVDDEEQELPGTENGDQHGDGG